MHCLHVQKHADNHLCDLNNSNAIRYDEIKIVELDYTCPKAGGPTLQKLFR